jgi:hypothetical protein
VVVEDELASVVLLPSSDVVLLLPAVPVSDGSPVEDASSPVEELSAPIPVDEEVSVVGEVVVGVSVVVLVEPPLVVVGSVVAVVSSPQATPRASIDSSAMRVGWVVNIAFCMVGSPESGRGFGGRAWTPRDAAVEEPKLYVHPGGPYVRNSALCGNTDVS